MRESRLLSMREGPDGNVRDVDFPGRAEDFDKLARHFGGLHSVRSFSGPGITGAQVAAIRVWPNLETVVLSRVNDEGADHLVGLANLKFVDLSWSEISDAGIKKLAEIKTLTTLKLRRTKITDKALADIGRLPHLEALDVSRCAVTDEGVRSLTGCKLTRLDLRDTKITDRGVELLKGMTTLEDLDVTSTRTTNEALAYLKGIPRLRVSGLPKTVAPAIPDDPKDMAALVAAGAMATLDGDTGNVEDLACPECPAPAAWAAHLKGLHSLKTLWLPRSTVDADMVHIRGLASLEGLVLGGAKISDKGLASVAALTHLRGLDVHGCARITDAGMAHLAGLKDLESIELGGAPIGDDGLRHLAGLTRLKGIGLCDTRVTDAGLANLSALKDLESLNLFGTAVTDAGLEHLRGLNKLSEVDPAPGVTHEGLLRLKKYCPGLVTPRHPKRKE
jgi:hypothetical protein